LNETRIREIAPNINLFLWRPILADPPVYTFADLQTWVTLRDVLDAHEALDLRSAIAEQAEIEAEKARQ
jgi:hypothetical protein